MEIIDTELQKKITEKLQLIFSGTNSNNEKILQDFMKK